MATRQLKDGRWIVYYRGIGKNGKSQVLREYFGRGAAGQSAAEKRDKELGLKKTRPARKKEKNGFTFGELAKEYYLHKNFSENSKNS